MVFGIGPAGTGKTFLAIAMALNFLINKRVERIVLTRPVVEAGEKLGFLPGDIQQKINPYLRPLYDALYFLIGFERTSELIEKGIIEIAPLAYMRGRTINDAFIILDEGQNTVDSQMKMFLTRFGLNSRVVVTADITQIDLERAEEIGNFQGHQHPEERAGDRRGPPDPEGHRAPPPDPAHHRGLRAGGKMNFDLELKKKKKQPAAPEKGSSSLGQAADRRVFRRRSSPTSVYVPPARSIQDTGLESRRHRRRRYRHPQGHDRRRQGDDRAEPAQGPGQALIPVYEFNEQKIAGSQMLLNEWFRFFKDVRKEFSAEKAGPGRRSVPASARISAWNLPAAAIHDPASNPTLSPRST